MKKTVICLGVHPAEVSADHALSGFAIAAHPLQGNVVSAIGAVAAMHKADWVIIPAAVSADPRLEHARAVAYDNIVAQLEGHWYPKGMRQVDLWTPNGQGGIAYAGSVQVPA